MDKLNQWLGLIANIGVLVGIGFLAYEIHQNTQMMQTQINQGRAELSMFEAEAMYNSEFLPEILAKLRRGESISEVQEERYRHFLRGVHRNWDNQLRQHREGFLTADVPRSVRLAVITEVASIPVARKHWDERKHAFTDEYVEFVDAILAEVPATP